MKESTVALMKQFQHSSLRARLVSRAVVMNDKVTKRVDGRGREKCRDSRRVSNRLSAGSKMINPCLALSSSSCLCIYVNDLMI